MNDVLVQCSIKTFRISYVHDDIVAKVKSLTDKPVKYIINTHAHGDHSGGNQKFLPSAQIIGHTNLRAAMIKGKQPGPPQLTFTDRMSISLGHKEVVAYHFAPCHTDGDTFLYFPAQKVLATGDCFNTGNGQGVNLTGSSTFSFYIDYNTGDASLTRRDDGRAETLGIGHKEAQDSQGALQLGPF